MEIYKKEFQEIERKTWNEGTKMERESIVYELELGFITQTQEEADIIVKRIRSFKNLNIKFEMISSDQINVKLQKRDEQDDLLDIYQNIEDLLK